MNSIDKPTLFLDEIRCKHNIKKMAEKASHTNCIFRPHFKTHQSLEVARWIREYGVTGATVSSTQMAKYFQQDGWNDFTIAFPFYPGMTKDLIQLEKSSTLRLFIHSTENIDLLDQTLSNPYKFYIEIDAGYSRSGISFEDTGKISSIINYAKQSKLAEFHGFYIHDGRTYKARGKKEIEQIIAPSLKALRKLKTQFPYAKTSLGDTPSASVLKDFEGIDELTPGNFIFYDWMQANISSCTPDEIAVYVQLPVAQSISNGNRAIVHGGAVHLSKDFITFNGKQNFGQLFVYSGNSPEIFTDSYLSALSQEHGTVSGFNSYPNKEYITVYPIHSCLTANLFDRYVLTSGKIIEKRVLS